MTIPPAQIFGIAFASVFAAELLGDKLLYTASALATRYRTVPVMVGIAGAFMVKMGIAVAAGQAVGALPPVVIAMISAVSFGWIAALLWRTRPVAGARRRHSTSEAAAVSFASVVLVEWGDIGQLTAATLAVQLQAPLLVWIASVSAMMTKATVAATAGAKVRPWIERSGAKRPVRLAAVGVVTVIGLWSVKEILERTH